MTDRVADTSLRLLAPRAHAEGFGDHDSLQNVNTFELPNGSLCWVNSTDGLYRLDKLSTDAPVLGIVIVPIAGPGRWILLSSASDLEQFSAQINLAAADLLTPNFPITPANAGEWTAGPTGVNIYIGEVLSPIFTADFDNGTLTYNGPPRIYRLDTYAVLNSPVFSGDGLMAITADKLSAATAMHDRIGFTNNDGTEAIESIDFDQFKSLAASRTTNLRAGDVIRPALTDTDFSVDPPPAAFELTVRRLQLVATPFA